MTTRKTITVLAFAMLLFCTCSADEIGDVLRAQGFIETNIPSGETLQKANHSRDEYVVEMNPDLVVRKAESKDRDIRTVFERDGLRYTGVNKGEWGGCLFVSDSVSDSTNLMDGNIRALVPVEEDLYIFEGLYHMGTNRGGVWIIRDCGTPSKPERITLLPGAPVAVTMPQLSSKPQFLIVGSDYAALLDGEEDLQIIAYDTFWDLLYPTSVVAFGTSLIIGLRSGIAVVEMDKFRLLHTVKIRYFVKSK